MMYVRNLSKCQVPYNGECPFMWVRSCIYAIIMESIHSCVLCVRNPSTSLMPWRCNYTLILEGDHLLWIL
jgi:hypothetical protein